MSGRLIVLGATGAIGRAVVGHALADGRGVVAVARDARALAQLKRDHDGDAGIATLTAAIASDADAARLAARIESLPGAPPMGVVAAIRGQAERGRLLDAPADFLQRRLDEDLLPHLFAARHLMPLLARQPDAGYVLVGGPGAEQPWAGYGHHSIGAAALRMLARVLHDEARALPLRVRMLAVDSPVRTAANARHACERWPDAGAIARQALHLLEGGGGNQALVRFPIRAASPVAGGVDDLDADDRLCAPHAARGTQDRLDDARRLLRRIAASPTASPAAPAAPSPSTSPASKETPSP